MPIDRTNYNALVDDDGSNTVGSIWNKNAIKTVILDPADAAYSPFASPAFTGVPTAPTAAYGTNSTQLATTAFVANAVLWTAVPYSASNFVGTGSMTWTVAAGNQVRFSYGLNGKTMIVSFYLDSTTIGGTVGNELRISIPTGATMKGWCTGFGWIIVGSLGIPSALRGAVGANYISVFKADLTNFALGTSNTIVTGTFPFEIN